MAELSNGTTRGQGEDKKAFEIHKSLLGDFDATLTK